jgi:CubicO group peptidase (beta-lactamase class C family)
MMRAMTAVSVDIDPAAAGFDAERLGRIDRHFDSYVEDGKLAGWLALVARDGRVVHAGKGGLRDIDRGLAVEDDTVWRIYSMTKPITSVAAMMLYEEGAFELKDPVANWIPSFADARVWSAGTAVKPVTVAVREPVRMWHLLTHTSGLSYGFHHAHPVDALYRAHGFEFGFPRDMSLQEVCDAWAELPLLFEPGSEWNYSHSTDVLGRVVEVISGRTLEEFFAERIFGPLGMTDTSFGPADPDRLAEAYMRDPATGRPVVSPLGRAALAKPTAFSGGGGLVGTAADYHRFSRMLLNGGELDGVRLLGSRTLRYMASNHLPGRADLEAFGRPLFAEVSFAGVGFGLGFAVNQDAVAQKVLSTPGEFNWGGLASTAFWVDPVERVTAQFFTQMIPSSTYPIRTQFRQLVYQALVD